MAYDLQILFISNRYLQIFLNSANKHIDQIFWKVIL